MPPPPLRQPSSSSKLQVVPAFASASPLRRWRVFRERENSRRDRSPTAASLVRSRPQTTPEARGGLHPRESPVGRPATTQARVSVTGRRALAEIAHRDIADCSGGLATGRNPSRRHRGVAWTRDTRRSPSLDPVRGREASLPLAASHGGADWTARAGRCDNSCCPGPTGHSPCRESCNPGLGPRLGRMHGRPTSSPCLPSSLGRDRRDCCGARRGHSRLRLCTSSGGASGTMHGPSEDCLRRSGAASTSERWCESPTAKASGPSRLQSLLALRM